MKIYKSGAMSGKFGDGIYYIRNGIQRASKLHRRYLSKNTKRWQDIKIAFKQAITLWNMLPAQIRGMWEEYAGTQGSPSDMERSSGAFLRHCPIPRYPPRPKLMRGRDAFAGCYSRAKVYGLKNLRVYPPLGDDIPLPPLISCQYDRANGELIIYIDTSALDYRISDAKAVLWITITRGKGYIVRKRCLDVFDIPRTPQRIERRYKGIVKTGKNLGYKPFRFKNADYAVVTLAAQTLVATRHNRAPVISACSNIEHFYMLNDPRYLAIEELIKSGEFIRVGEIKFVPSFRKRIAKIRKARFIAIKPRK